MGRTIGTLSSWNRHAKPPCQVPGCKRAADTIGQIGKGRVGNVCSQCASKAVLPKGGK
jgi:hypothetical protein